MYRLLFSVFRSTAGSWENLHLRPLSQWPFLKNWQSTVLGSTPKGTFCTWTGLKSSAASFLASSEAFFSFSRCNFSASFFFSAGDLAPAAACWRYLICFCAAPPFLFFIPKDCRDQQATNGK